MNDTIDFKVVTENIASVLAFVEFHNSFSGDADDGAEQTAFHPAFPHDAGRVFSTV